MRQIVLVVVIIFTLIILVTQYNESKAHRNNARANLVVAQGQSRLDSAEAFSIIIMSTIPYVTFAIIGGAIACVFMVSMATRKEEETRKNLTVNNYILVPILGETRREVYKRLPNYLEGYKK